MIGRGLMSLALMALILSLDARSLYRKKRWSNHPHSNLRDALEDLQAEKRTRYPMDPRYYGYELFTGEPADKSYVTSADMEELKAILGPERVDQDTISPEAMAKLLEEGEPAFTSSSHPVSVSELEDIFDSDQGNDELEKKRKRQDTKRQDTKRGGQKKRTVKREDTKRYDEDDVKEEWLLKSLFEDEDRERVDKKKRQTSEIELTPEVEILQTENELLHEENSYLAGALNAATLGQAEQTGKYLSSQFGYLKKALDTEKSLNQLNGEDDMDERKKKRNEGDEEDHDHDDVDEEKRKKKLASIKEDEPTEYAQINPLLRKLVDEYSKEELDRRADQLKQGEKYEERKKKQDEEVEEDVLAMEAPGIGRGPAALAQPDIDEDEEHDDDEESDDEDMVANLQTMVANLSPRERHLMEDEVSTLMDSGLLETKCPAVEGVADGCEDLMRKFSVELDEQAMDVCSRHKVCYSCGSSIDPQKTLNREACDRIFVQQVKSLCGKEEQCRRSASGLFMLMKQQHGYIDWPSPMTAELCSQKCVVDFLLADGE